jgi:hypothetical protein
VKPEIFYPNASPVLFQQTLNTRPLAKVLSRSLYSNIFEDYQLSSRVK